MASSRPIYRFGLGADARTDGLARPLAQRLEPLVGDRVASAAEVVREASRILRGALRVAPGEPAAEHPPEDAAGASSWLAERLAPVKATHGWRAPVARWTTALEGVLEVAHVDGLDAPPRELFAEELGLWCGGADELGPDGRPRSWGGRPLGAGVRLPERGACVEALLPELGRGETILVCGNSQTVLRGLERVLELGLAPEVVLGEGGAQLTTRPLARRLAAAGARVRVVYDAALPGWVERADRVWLGSEALGAFAFLAGTGTRTVLEQAGRCEVPVALLATSDKLMPGGDLRLPPWGDADRWLLWDDAPPGVRVESQPFESVPHELAPRVASEHGLGSVAELSLAALPTDDLAG